MFNKIKDIYRSIKDKYKQFGEKHPDIAEWTETIIFVLVMIVLIRYFLFEMRLIPSGSMIPTLKIGDKVVVERVSHFTSKPKRGDILVFYPPKPYSKLNMSLWGIFARRTGIGCKDIAYIKRLIGLPGDKIEVKRNPNGDYILYLNDKPYEENYILNTYDSEFGPITVPEGKYFMMGDNRGNSQDSRYWGCLDEGRIIGRACLIWWPLNRIKVLGTE